MKTYPALSHATSPLCEAPLWGSRFWERARVRAKVVEMMKLAKRQIGVTIFAEEIEAFEGLKIRKASGSIINNLGLEGINA